jgi:hypothetical protein
MTVTIRRRELLVALGGAAAAWPLAARAQQRERMRRIGVLMPLAGDDSEGQVRNAAFLQGLHELGWAVGRNLRLDYRWAAGDADRLRIYAAELVALAPDGGDCGEWNRRTTLVMGAQLALRDLRAPGQPGHDPARSRTRFRASRTGSTRRS